MNPETKWQLCQTKMIEAQKTFREIVLPEVQVLSEYEVYSEILKLRNSRNKCIKVIIELRRLKSDIRDNVKEYKAKKDELLSNFFSSDEDPLKGLKTKEERDVVINNKINQSGLVDWADRSLQLDETISIGNTVIAELQKIFEEFELIYNISRLESFGHTLAQANSKLNDVLEK